MYCGEPRSWLRAPQVVGVRQADVRSESDSKVRMTVKRDEEC